MPWESDEEKASPGRDWAKYMWWGVAVLMALGIAAMFVPWQKQQTDTTRARVGDILIKLDGKDQAGKEAAVKQIKDIRTQILNGANFAKLAAQYSDDTLSASKGGDLGWVQRGELSKEIDEFVWSARLNQISDVFVSDAGLRLMIVFEREISDAEKYEIELKNRVLKQQGAADAPKP